MTNISVPSGIGSLCFLAISSACPSDMSVAPRSKSSMAACL